MKVKRLLQILALVDEDAEVLGGDLPTSVEVLESVKIHDDPKKVTLKFKYKLKEELNET